MQGGRTGAWTRTLLLALLLSGALLLVAATARTDVAHAGSYLTFICHDDSGAAMPADLTTQQNSGAYASDYFHVTNTCANGGQGSVGLVVGGCGGCNFGALGLSSIFQAPAGETISGYGIRFAAATAPCQMVDGRCNSGQGEAFVADAQHQAPGYAFLSAGQGIGGPFEIGGSNINSGFLEFHAGCDAQHGTCPAGSTVSGLYVSLGHVVLEDRTAPQVLGVGGPLVAGGPVSGTASVSYTAQDSGGGIFAQHAYVDGSPVRDGVIDPNGGRCVDHGTVPGMHSFGYVQPCKASVTTSLALDTTQLSDGVHTLRVDVEDAAGDRAQVYSGPLTVANGAAGAASALSLSLGVAPQGAGGGAQSAGRCAPAAGGSLAPGPGSSAVLTAQVSCGGQPLGGTALTVADDRGFQSQLTTDSTGSVRLTVPHRAAHLTIIVFGQTLDLSTRLRAITFSISPRATRNGHSMRWRGAVSDFRAGMKLLLEVRKGSGWTIFDQTSVDRNGHFSYRYTFRATSGTVRYTFRVVARDGSAASPTRSILVRG